MKIDSPLSERTGCKEKETPSIVVCRALHGICIYMWNYNVSNDLENKIRENTKQLSHKCGTHVPK